MSKPFGYLFLGDHARPWLTGDRELAVLTADGWLTKAQASQLVGFAAKVQGRLLGMALDATSADRQTWRARAW